MKRSILLVFTTIALIFTAVQVSAAQLSTKKDKLSYAIGVETGKAFKTHGVIINPNAFSEGLKDATTGKKLQLSQSEIREVLVSFRQKSIKKLQAKMQKSAASNQKLGAAFLKANKKKAGIVTTPTGLQYKILKKGSGKSPTKNDVVTVNYEGKLISGKVFDSSYKRGKPATFPVAGVIAGWQEALTKMKTGATWMLYIPPNLAYGLRGAPGTIGPNATLIFKVNLISIKK